MAWQHLDPFFGVGDAGEDLRDFLYFALKLGADGRLVRVTAIDDLVIGINQEDADENRDCTVQYHATSKAVLGGTVATGAAVEIAADGRLVASGTGVGATQVGICMEGGAENDVVPVLLRLIGAGAGA